VIIRKKSPKPKKTPPGQRAGLQPPKPFLVIKRPSSGRSRESFSVMRQKSRYINKLAVSAIGATANYIGYNDLIREKSYKIAS
jgi:hypothetical protein